MVGVDHLGNTNDATGNAGVDRFKITCNIIYFCRRFPREWR